MSNYDAIRWLHLSDFHVGMDDYAQRKLFAEITSELKRRIDGGEGPDFVFITGDIENTGIKDQYNDFFESFIIDLIDALEENSEAKIFMVPGNHDVDRTKAQFFEPSEILKPEAAFFDPSDSGKNARDQFFPRFTNYATGVMDDSPNDWLSSKKVPIPRKSS